MRQAHNLKSDKNGSLPIIQEETMCYFKAALIAKFEDKILLYSDFDEDHHYGLSRQLIDTIGNPLGICPIEVTCGKIKIDLMAEDIEPWMRDYVEKHEKEIKDIEIQSLERMKTHKLRELNIRGTIGFRIPEGSQIKEIQAQETTDLIIESEVVAESLDVRVSENCILAEGAKIENISASYATNLLFKGPIIAEYLDVSNTDGIVIPKGSKINQLYAFRSQNLTFEGPVVVQFLKVRYTEGIAIPKGSQIKILDAEYSENLTLDDDCEIELLLTKRSSGMIIPSTCKIGRKYV